MPNTTSIHIEWDATGHITHSFSGARLAPPRDDLLLWVLAPSAPLFLTHQFGAMKPSHGLIASQQAIDILFYNKYVLTPINSALKAALLDVIYPGGPAVKIQFHPRHGLFANSDSVEEGARQLLNNYMRYVFSQLDDYTRIVVRTITTAGIGAYFDLLQDEMRKGAIGRGRDQWNLSFPALSTQVIGALSQAYYVPEGGRTAKNEEWARKQTEHVEENRIQLESMRESIFVAMGLY